MESRKVRRPLRERRPEHFYQDFSYIKKLMNFCPRKSCLCTSSSL